MSESKYGPSIEEIRAHAEKKAAEATERRLAEAKKKSRKQRAAITAAGLAAAAAMGLGIKEALNSDARLPDERYTPTREQKAYPESDELTEEQKEEKRKLDEAESREERARVDESLAPTDVPNTVRDQNFEGLDTTKIE